MSKVKDGQYPYGEILNEYFLLVFLTQNPLVLVGFQEQVDGSVSIKRNRVVFWKC